MKNEKKEPKFEEAMARLEEIVGLLENGGAPLDETMSLYAEGAKLAALCSERLEKAEQTVAVIAGGETPEKGKKNQKDKKEQAEKKDESIDA